MRTDAFDTLSTLAQLALALAGFSAVTVAFRRAGESGSWLREDVFRFIGMLRFSLGSALLAVLPAILRGFVASPALLWRGMNVLMLVVVVASLVAIRNGTVELKEQKLSPVVFVFGSGFLGGAIALQALGALDIVDPASAYVGAVGILCTLAGLLFYRLTTIPIAAGR